MNYFDEITLNGQGYFRDDLVRLVNKGINEPTISDFKKSLYSFIDEWISDKITVTVNTSGTTGMPKSISFRKEQFINSALMTCNYFNLTDRTTGLLCLSPDYIAGKMMVVRAFVSGMDLITLEPSDKPLLGIAGKKIDFAAFVPLQVQNLSGNEISKKRFQTIKNVIIGGAPISPSLEKELESYTNSIYATFAMTETLSHVALRRLSGKSRSDKYFALQGVDFESDNRGCLIVNAPLVNDAPVITNDIVELNDSTHFKWLGRYDNVINSGGIKIHPEIVENKLATLIPDHRFFIAALPDEKFGQKVVIVIEVPENMDIAGIKTLTEKTLSKYEIPKEYYRVEKFIETPTGKVKKEETLKLATQF
ncbi:MAG TPA: AMP-binding protein [Bacteroidia bacterium]|nr:AMP-binding protein [Bacteroidia bacterium]